MKQQANTVSLNRETYELLQQVQEELTIKLGFEPTNGQVVRHLLAAYYGEANYSGDDDGDQIGRN